MEIILDGVGVLGTVKDFAPYPKKCKAMLDMCICGSYVILSHNSGIAKVNFESRQETTVLSNNTEACKEVCGVATLEQTTVVFTDMGSRQVKSSTLNGEIKLIAGTGIEGNNDGTLESFSQPMGICVKSKKTLLVTDAQTGSIKLITEISGAVAFLDSLGKLYHAFSVHLKHHQYKIMPLTDAQENVNLVSNYLLDTVNTVTSKPDTTRELNGPEGTISSKTLKSIIMIKNGLTRISDNIKKINIDVEVNPQALLTVKVENLHAVSHFKHPTCSQLQYARDFGATMLESAKRMTRWSAYYFTHSSSYYPPPSTQICLSDIPKMQQPKKPSVSINDQKLTRQWAKDHGKCVRQCTVRQETTKFKAATLPLNMYESAKQI